MKTTEFITNQASSNDKKERGGVVPFYTHNGQTFYLLLVPSDKRFGGTDWQLAKGRIDPGENVQDAAIREGMEELGILEDSIVSVNKVWSGTLTGDRQQYAAHFFAVEMNTTELGEHDWETAKVKWFPEEEALQVIRKNQLPILKAAIQFNGTVDEVEISRPS